MTEQLTLYTLQLKFLEAETFKQEGLTVQTVLNYIQYFVKESEKDYIYINIHIFIYTKYI